MAQNESELLAEAFFNFDEERRGTFTLEELRYIVTSNGEAMPDVEEFLQEAQQYADGSGNIDYRAFAYGMAAEDDG